MRIALGCVIILQIKQKGSKNALIKILGRGEINRAVSVKAHAWSKSAEEAVTAAGGSLEKLPLPFAVRPPSSGNAHMNR